MYENAILRVLAVNFGFPRDIKQKEERVLLFTVPGTTVYVKAGVKGAIIQVRTDGSKRGSSSQ
jgi:hypothetical protein